MQSNKKIPRVNKGRFGNKGIGRTKARAKRIEKENKLAKKKVAPYYTKLADKVKRGNKDGTPFRNVNVKLKD